MFWILDISAASYFFSCWRTTTRSAIYPVSTLPFAVAPAASRVCSLARIGSTSASPAVPLRMSVLNESEPGKRSAIVVEPSCRTVYFSTWATARKRLEVIVVIASPSCARTTYVHTRQFSSSRNYWNTYRWSKSTRYRDREIPESDRRWHLP